MLNVHLVMEGSWKVMKFEICIPGWKRHGISGLAADSLKVKKFRKLCVEHQDIHGIGLKVAQNLGIFFPSFCVNPVDF